MWRWIRKEGKRDIKKQNCFNYLSKPPQYSSSVELQKRGSRDSFFLNHGRYEKLHGSLLGSKAAIRRVVHTAMPRQLCFFFSLSFFLSRLQSLSRKLQGTHQSSEEALACPFSFSFLGVKTKNQKNENKKQHSIEWSLFNLVTKRWVKKKRSTGLVFRRRRRRKRVQEEDSTLLKVLYSHLTPPQPPSLSFFFFTSPVLPRQLMLTV